MRLGGYGVYGGRRVVVLGFFLFGLFWDNMDLGCLVVVFFVVHTVCGR